MTSKLVGSSLEAEMSEGGEQPSPGQRLRNDIRADLGAAFESITVWCMHSAITFANPAALENSFSQIRLYEKSNSVLDEEVIGGRSTRYIAATTSYSRSRIYDVMTLCRLTTGTLKLLSCVVVLPSAVAPSIAPESAAGIDAVYSDFGFPALSK